MGNYGAEYLSGFESGRCGRIEAERMIRCKDENKDENKRELRIIFDIIYIREYKSKY